MRKKQRDKRSKNKKKFQRSMKYSKCFEYNIPPCKDKDDDCYKYCLEYIMTNECNLEICSAEKLRENQQQKICECFIICQDNKIIALEIIDGTLTKRELNDKKEQLNSCKNLLNKALPNKHIKVECCLIYKRFDSYLKKKKNLNLMKDKNIKLHRLETIKEKGLCYLCN